jgi:membrane-bound metal-dependent hydrolase YbcI (DUF457 family)
MTYKTHIAFALTAAIPISNYTYGLSSLESFLFLATVSLAALAPDLDEEGSYLSKKLPIFSMTYDLFNVKHRGVTHKAKSIVFLILLFMLINFLENLDNTSYIDSSVYLGFIFGYLFHHFGDMLTKGGINEYFEPLSGMKAVLLPRKYRFYTASSSEFSVFALLSSIVALEFVYFTGVLVG